MKIRNLTDKPIRVAKTKEKGEIVILVGPKDFVFYEDEGLAIELESQIIGKPKMVKSKNTEQWKSQEVKI